jgi:putative ABC transport system permease protein
VWRITWRDLVYRGRRFLLAAAATTAAFTVALLLSGVIVAVHTQNEDVVERFEADAWWVPAGSGGPFTGGPVVDVDRIDELRAAPGVDRAEGVLISRATVTDAEAPGDGVKDVNLVGVEIGHTGMPEVAKGRAIDDDGEAVVDAELGIDVGEVITTGGRDFEVVGVADGISYLFGVPAMFLGLADAQQVGAGGQGAVSAIVTGGTPRVAPRGLVAWEDDEVISDLNRLVGQGFSAVQTMRVVMLVAALGIVALMVYLGALERVRDVAVLKATGASSSFVAGGLIVQSLVVTTAATIGAMVLARALKPLFPLRLELTGQVHLELAALGLVAGLVASVIGIRRVLSVEPVEAFG